MSQHCDEISSHYAAESAARCEGLISQLASEYGFSEEEARQKFLPTEEPKAAKLRKKSAKGAKKAKKDPTKPKRAKNPYFLFTAAKRATIKEQHPEAKPTEIAKLLGVAWEECKEAGEAGPYEEAAAADKKRYEDEMKAWVPQTDSDSD